MILLIFAVAALAQEEIEVIGDRPDPADTASSVTIIEVDESLSASVDVADAMTLAPGTVVHRLGGLGAWSSVSIRGSTSRQVEIFLDGIPLNPEGSTPFDLSELPLRAFERIEVYRGSAPPYLGSTSIGGAVNLVTGDSESTGASLGGGSFGTVRGSGMVSGQRYLLFADAFRTAGNFEWFDDRSTIFIVDDDRFMRRQNNDKAQGSVLGRVDIGDEKLALTLLNSFVSRAGGVPGFTFAPTERVRYGLTRDLLVASAEGTTGSVRLTGRGYGMLRHETLDDRRGEIGVGRTESVDRSRSVGARTSADWGVSSGLGVFTSVEVRSDRYDHTEVLTGSDDPPQIRNVTRGSVAATAAFAHQMLFIVPVARLYAADRLEISPQFGFRLVPSETIVLKGSVGRYVRPPDLLELYGDRGLMRGNPDLRSEVGLNVDLGVQARAEGDAGSAQFEVAGFWTESADRIVWVQNAQGVALPLNLQNARIRGVEVAATLHWMERLEASTNFTRMGSENLDSDPALAGNQLPLIPGWQLHHRTALVWKAVRIGHRYDFSDVNYWDLTNWFRSPPRHLHGAFVRVSAADWSVEADVLNLTDRIVESVPLDPLRPGGDRVDEPVTDFAGYPLAGRSFLLTMRWSR